MEMQHGVSGQRSIRLVGLLALLIWSSLAFAQGFMVSPMRFDIVTRPGKVTEQAVSIRNTTNLPIGLLISVGKLTQTEDGRFTVYETEDEEQVELPRDGSPWISVSTGEVEISPVGTLDVPLHLKTPNGTRGCYSAALLVESKPPKLENGKLGMVFQFIIPIIIDVQGPQAQERVVLADTDLVYTTATDKRPATTNVAMRVTNEGETYCRLQGKATVYCPGNQQWRRFTEVTLPERGILPGMSLTIAQDLQRRLPSGRYKVQLQLFSSGKQKGRLEKEITFAGDPNETAVSADIPLLIDPPEVSVSAVAGSRRTINLTLSNPSTETVQVEGQFLIPPSLRNVTRDTLSGTDFDCSPWLAVDAPSFTLKGGEMRHCRLTVTVPKTPGTLLPEYYADLLLKLSHPDGQAAGSYTIPLCVTNTRMDGEPKALAGDVSIAQENEGQYTVTTRFTNIGNIAFTPSSGLRLVTPTGRIVLDSMMQSTSANSRMLPLCTPVFTGTLDFSKVPAGDYLVVATMSYAKNGSVSTSLPVHVEIVNEQRIVTVIDQPVAGEPTAAEAK